MPASDDEDKREFPRRSVLWRGRLRAGKYDFDCQIWNISLGGAKVKVKLPLKEGAEVMLTLPRTGEIVGHIAWQDDETLGLAFDTGPESIRSIFGDTVIALGLDVEET